MNGIVCSTSSPIFTEKVSHFFLALQHGIVQRCRVKVILRIHIRTFSDKQFGDFFVTFTSRIMQRSQVFIIFHLHIRTSVD